jgi:streptogramin lyase
MRTLALLLASALAAIAVTVGQAGSAVGIAAAAGCPKGSVKAVIGGRSTCLRTGAKCQARYAAQYRKHRFVCKNGRLRKAPKAPTGPVYPHVPNPPSGPAATAVVMPAASPLPGGARTLSMPATAWSADITDLAVAPDAVWVSSGPFRIDPQTNTASGPFSSVESQDIGVGEGSVWASNWAEDAVRRLDATTGKETAVVKLPAGSAPEGIVDAAGAIWVATHHGGTVVRIDPATNRVAATVPLVSPGSSGPQGIAVGLGSVWVDVPRADAVFRIAPATNKVTAVIALPFSISPCGGIAVGQTAVWVTGCLDVGTVARIDPATNKVVSILDVGGLVIQPAADGDSVWFVTGGDPDQSPNTVGYLVQLRADDTVARRIQLGPGFISGGTAVAFGSIWVSDFAHPRVIRIPST